MTGQYVSFPLREFTRANKFLRFDDAFDTSKAGFFASRTPRKDGSVDDLPLVPYTKDAMRILFPEAKTSRVPFEISGRSGALIVNHDYSANIIFENQDETEEKGFILPCPLQATQQALEVENYDTLFSEVGALISQIRKEPMFKWHNGTGSARPENSPWSDLSPQTPEEIAVYRTFCQTATIASSLHHPEWGEEEHHIALNGCRVRPNGTLTPPRVLLIAGQLDYEPVELPPTPFVSLMNEAFQGLLEGLQPSARISQEWPLMDPDKSGMVLRESALQTVEISPATTHSAHQKMAALSVLKQHASKGK